MLNISWHNENIEESIPVPALTEMTQELRKIHQSVSSATNSLCSTISLEIKACGVRTSREWSFLEEIISKQLFKNIHKPLSQDKCVGKAGREEDGGGSKGDRLQLETTGGSIRHFENNGGIVSKRTEYSLQKTFTLITVPGEENKHAHAPRVCSSGWWTLTCCPELERYCCSARHKPQPCRCGSQLLAD